MFMVPRPGRTMMKFCKFTFLFTATVTHSIIQSATGDEWDPDLDSPFNFYVAAEETIFERKILILDALYCSVSDCYYPYFSQYSDNPRCRPCSCDKSCFEYHICCPYAYLESQEIQQTQNESMIPVSDETLQRSCLQPSPAPSSEGKMFFLINTCPNATPTDVMFNCERSNSTDIMVRMPVVGISNMTYVQYKNSYCATCNGANITRTFNITVKCYNDSSVFTNASSNLDVYNTAIRADGCTVDFDEEFAEVCYPSDQEGSLLIQSCNITGLWTQYDPLVEKACLLDFYRIPFDDIYYNFFCYFCNTNLTWTTLNYARRSAGDVSTASAPLLQASFVLPIHQPVMENICHVLDNTGQCRDVFCSVHRKFDNIFRKCRNSFASNAFGYEICIELRTHTQDASLAASQIYDNIRKLKDRLQGDGVLTDDLHFYDIEVWQCFDSRHYRQQFLMKVFVQDVNNMSYIDDVIFEKTGFLYNIKPVGSCGEARAAYEEEEGCEITVVHGSGYSLPNIHQEKGLLKHLADHVFYLPFSRLLTCCQMMLGYDDVSFDGYGNIIIKNSNAFIWEGNYIKYENKSVAVCVNDYVDDPALFLCNDSYVSLEGAQVGADDRAADTLDGNMTFSNNTSLNESFPFQDVENDQGDTKVNISLATKNQYLNGWCALLTFVLTMV